jgi:hypothetical protein
MLQVVHWTLHLVANDASPTYVGDVSNLGDVVMSVMSVMLVVLTRAPAGRGYWRRL